MAVILVITSTYPFRWGNLDEVTKSFSIKVQWSSTWKWHRVSCNIRSTTWSRTLKRDPGGRRQTIKNKTNQNEIILMILMIVTPEQWTSHFLLHHERCKWGWKGSCSEEREPFGQKTKKNRQKTKNGKMEKGITPPVPQYQPHCPQGIQPPLTEERKDFD